MIPYDIWRIRNGAVVHEGTTDTTLGVLGPRDIGAIAKGAVVLMYRGGSKAQQAQLAAAARERAVRGVPPPTTEPVGAAEPEGDGLAPPLGDGDEVPTNGCDGEDEGPARAVDDDCDEAEDDGEAEDTENIEAPRQRGRPRTVRAAPKAVRSVYRPPPEAPPSTLFAPAAMPCRDCGETSGHTSRCPRNPDAEIQVEPIYAPRPTAVSYQRSVDVEEPLREEPTGSPSSPPEPPAALADEARPPQPPLAELDLGAALPAPEVDPQPTAPSPVAASLPPRRRSRPERAPGEGTSPKSTGGAGQTLRAEHRAAAPAAGDHDHAAHPRDLPTGLGGAGAGDPARGSLRRPVDTGEVGLGGVQEYLRSIDAPREVAVGCSLPFCFERAAAGRFCREHQPLMEAR